MKILITGGCGFIGSNFIHYFLKKHPEDSLVNLDNLSYAGNLENLRDIENNPNYCFIKGDICDKKVVEEAMRNCEALINFAAESHVDRSIKEAKPFIQTNVVGVFTLLEVARKSGISRFIQVGTDESYGSIKRGSFSEESPLQPNSPYAATKAAADLLVRSYFITYRLPVMITRSSNNFGPYQYPEKLIPLFITNLMENKKVPLYGRGKNIRDWLYVEDNCKAIDLILIKGKLGEIYNISGGNERTNLTITEAILKNMHQGKEMIELVKDRPGHDFRYSLNNRKIRKLGWKPEVSFREGLIKTIRWYQKNDAWWRRLK
ncbi:MAG: dTDP-glucose 4,6-dehydratase [bacterium (Candidatus Ratteibacteria) CG_4_10_14_3_um_filter_41_18]|uniref:dTDP-glucose 4,6-dehydratase n=2 Tax=Candidatus Ratteibacteria TaxID=2979319 RepID=A0A2M7YGJ5_9BACT|nr:MAG: dTDP-glucose 4,6-dehydratase [bacterium (Candidatus Ratteibacteria) CG_4_10_14_3_um_filter_41_18]PJA62084.1 MAG: dTDP-glucose 4,6-dehydratase [bacterium (Candidatus Ratteibacteria) CG_4_9_14_3_um_filter_41_21]